MTVERSKALCPNCGGTLRHAPKTESQPTFAADEDTIELDVRTRCSICDELLIGIHFQVRGLCEKHALKEIKRGSPKIAAARITMEIPAEQQKKGHLRSSYVMGLVLVAGFAMATFFFRIGDDVPEKATKVATNSVEHSDAGSALGVFETGPASAGDAPNMVEGLRVPTPKAGLSPQQAVEQVNKLLGNHAAAQIVGQPSGLPGSQKATPPGGRPTKLQQGDIASATKVLKADSSKNRHAAIALLELLVPQGRCKEITPTFARLAAEKGPVSVADYMRHLVACELDVNSAKAVGEAVLGLPRLTPEHSVPVVSAMVEVLLFQGLEESAAGHCTVLKAAPLSQASSNTWRARARCDLVSGQFPKSGPPVDSSQQDRALWQLAQLSRGERTNVPNFTSWNLDGAFFRVVEGFRGGANPLALLDGMIEPLFAPASSHVEPLKVPWSSKERETLLALVPAKRRDLARAYLETLLGATVSGIKSISPKGQEREALVAIIESRNGNSSQALAALERVKADSPYAWVQLVEALAQKQGTEDRLRDLLKVESSRPRAFRALVDSSLATSQDIESMKALASHPDVLVALVKMGK